jgi:hypothetical protein
MVRRGPPNHVGAGPAGGPAHASHVRVQALHGGTHTRYVETPAEAKDVHAYPVCLECQHYLGPDSEPEGNC